MDSLTDYDELRECPSLFVEQVLGISPFDYQAEFLDAQSRFRGLASGRQIGKTRMCAWDGLHGALTEPHSMTLITAPSLRQSSLLFKQLRSEMSQSGIDDNTWGVNRDTQTIIEFDNGAEIHCLPTGRNGNKIRGFSADKVIVDEAAFINEEIFEEVLEPMILATDGRMVLASTPFGTSGYFYDKVTSWAMDGDGDSYSTWSPDDGGISSHENPLISEEDVERFKEGKTERQIKQEVLGQFIEDGSQYFETHAIRDSMPGGTVDRAEGAATYLGVDIAAAGGAETVLISVDGDGNVFKIDTQDNAGVLEASTRIKTLDRQFDYERIVVDETGIGKGTAEDLARTPRIKQKLEPLYLSVQRKQSAYQGLKAALEGGDLVLPQDDILRSQLEAIGYSTTSAGNLSISAENGNDDYCFVAGTQVATPDGDVPIEELSNGDTVLTRNGPQPIIATGHRDALVVERNGLRGTPDHPLITDSGIQQLLNARASTLKYICEEIPSYSTETGITDTQRASTNTSETTTGPTLRGARLPSIVKNGENTMVKSLATTSSTTKTATHSTTTSTTSSVCQSPSTSQCTLLNGFQTLTSSSSNVSTWKTSGRRQQSGTKARKESNGTKNTTRTSKTSSTNETTSTNVSSVETHTRVHGRRKQSSARSHVKTNDSTSEARSSEPVSAAEKCTKRASTVTHRRATQPVQQTSEKETADVETVYNITVAEEHEYFANGILVHNCDALALAVWGMPDTVGSRGTGASGATNAVFGLNKESADRQGQVNSRNAQRRNIDKKNTRRSRDDRRNNGRRTGRRRRR